jgi:pSer/pThr/pTyr-binding forkhead associated (FHA) protein
VLADKAVSREHILIREENERFTLYDRGSKTGTLVNDRRVEYPVLLEHDDLIVIGDTRLRFVIGR